MLGALASGLLLAFTSASARADDGDHDARERARRSFSEAKTAFGQHNYTAAAAAFEEAARLVAHPSTWLNAAEAWELAGDLTRAAEDCDRAIAMDPATTHAADATRRLERLVARIATLEVNGPPALLVRLQSGEPRSPPFRARLSPGRHSLIVVDTANHHDRKVEVDLAAGQTRALDLSPSEAKENDTRAPPQANTIVRTHGGIPLVSKVAFGGGIACAAATAVLGFMTVDAKGDYEADPTRSSLDSFKRTRLLTNVALAATLVSGGVGLVLWIVSPQPSGTPTRAGDATRSVLTAAPRAILPGGLSF